MSRLIAALLLLVVPACSSSTAFIDDGDGVEVVAGGLTTEVPAGTELVAAGYVSLLLEPDPTAYRLEKVVPRTRLIAAGGPLRKGYLQLVRGDFIVWGLASKLQVIRIPDAGADAGREPVDGGVFVRDGGSFDVDAGWVDVADAGAPTVIRVIAANLTSGPAQSYEAAGTRLLQTLQGDVVALQEFNVGDNQDSTLRAWVGQTFGPEFHYVRGSSAGPYPIPNGIVTRLPLLASGEWIDPRVTNRTFTWARLDVPGTAELWVVSVHLLTSGETARADEANALMVELRRAVPAGDHVVIAGDFNTTRRSEPCLSTLAAIATAGVGSAFPTDGSNGNTNASRGKPYDHVLASDSLRALERPVRLGSRQFPNGLVFDSRTWTPLTDAPPARYEDSAAFNMQHMPVVRAFEL
ncbi:MAG: endonuclease/exonuclease/phosphatase family protein [Myxococcales bacterium]|nr:endonuclease/exonuclease/phosphatase family protein [Myxococcales bacterium]